MRALHMLTLELKCSWLLQGQSCSCNRLPESCYDFFLQDEGQVRDSLVLLFPSKASRTCWSRGLQLPIENGLPKHDWTLYHLSRKESSRINLIRFLWHKNSCGGNEPLLVKMKSCKTFRLCFPHFTFWLGNFVTSVSNKDIQLYSTYSLKSRVTNSFII